MSEVARECETSRSTVSGYLELLEDLLLAFRLPVFTRRAKRRLVAHPRFFHFRNGVDKMATSSPAWTLDIARQIKDAGGGRETQAAFVLHKMTFPGPGDYGVEFQTALNVWKENPRPDTFDNVVKVRSRIDAQYCGSSATWPHLRYG